MELTVRSLQGSYIVSGLDSDATVADVKQLLHKQHSQQVPEPEEQRLVSVHSASSALEHMQPQHEAVEVKHHYEGFLMTNNFSYFCMYACRCTSIACCPPLMQHCSTLVSHMATSW
jgi:hypothetical protein